jgi:hypothetical protein
MKHENLSIANQTTGWVPWPGGMMLIGVEGQFASDGNVSTAGTVVKHAIRPDGISDGKFRPVITFTAPGSHAVAVEPGFYRVNASGPEDLPWSMTVTIDK